MYLELNMPGEKLSRWKVKKFLSKHHTSLKLLTLPAHHKMSNGVQVSIPRSRPSIKQSVHK
jgi:hypothetical protein